MEIKFKDKPITIKTVEIDGKKLTKQFLQQLMPEFLFFKKYDDEIESETYSISDILYLKSGEVKKYYLDGEIIGWINIKLEKEDYIRNMLGILNPHINTFTMILFVNMYGELSRSYMEATIYNVIYGDKYPQIFI